MTKSCGYMSYYFGPWDDPNGAIAKYLERKDDLHAGRTPRPDTGATTVKVEGRRQEVIYLRTRLANTLAWNDEAPRHD